jgi:hypothetical protein
MRSHKPEADEPGTLGPWLGRGEGTVAYRGVIPPEAIEVVEPGDPSEYGAGQGEGLRPVFAADWDLHNVLGMPEPVVKWAYSPQDGFLVWPADDEKGRPYHEQMILA